MAPVPSLASRERAREIRPNSDRGRDVELTPHNLPPCVVDGVLPTVPGSPERADRRCRPRVRRRRSAVSTIPQPWPDPTNGNRRHPAARRTLQRQHQAGARERSSAHVREDEPSPDEGPVLAELHVVVVPPDRTSALRHKQDTAGWAVVDVFGDLRGDLAGRSDRMPVISAADITAPPEGRSAILAQRRDRAQPSCDRPRRSETRSAGPKAEAWQAAGARPMLAKSGTGASAGAAPQQQLCPGFRSGRDGLVRAVSDFLKRRCSSGLMPDWA